MVSYCIQQFIIHDYHCLPLILKLPQSWPVVAPSSGSWGILARVHHSLSISLISGTTSHSSFILYFPRLSPRISHDSKEPQFL